MAKIVLYSAVSVDGYIADKNGDVDWLHGFEEEGEDYGYSDFYQSVKFTLMGRNTYNQILSFDVPFPYADKKNFVFSESLKSSNSINTEIINEDYISKVEEIKNSNEGLVWLVGGGQLNSLLLKNGLIDELILSLIPVVLGEGIPLFNIDSKLVKLILQKSKTYKTGIIQQYYQVVKE
ncbi:dihydrofolate reductase family protein [Carboxylicivirga caseinilyticus]|uniref:dihydrofolate reductase family protein n=1 Tax=Carboxylicivirga caseinilyticus TaxID=3417572 RepID=UPI003D357FF2|nr:dihydrofolate reductase [Marinilabiliaceae bacterium A049]